MRKHSTTRQSGFTLVELVVMLAVLVVLVSYVVPSYQTMIANSAIRSTAVELVSVLGNARADSLSRRVCATVTLSSGGWSLIYPDTATAGCPASTMTAIKSNGTPSGSAVAMQVVDSAGTKVTSITFQPNGFINVAKSPVVFTVCDNRTGETGKQVTLQKSGKTGAVDVTCS